MASEPTVGRFVEHLKDQAPAWVRHGGLLWRYEGEVDLKDWLTP